MFIDLTVLLKLTLSHEVSEDAMVQLVLVFVLSFANTKTFEIWSKNAFRPSLKH